MLKKLKKNLKSNKGFTLVELVVVIVIILVLSAATVPQVLKYVERAEAASCKSDAATVLSQVQTDVAAMQAAEITGVDTISEINGVTITEGYVADPGEGNATYQMSSNGGEFEIIAFSYANDTHYATWSADSGWTVTQRD